MFSPTLCNLPTRDTLWNPCPRTSSDLAPDLCISSFSGPCLGLSLACTVPPYSIARDSSCTQGLAQLPLCHTVLLLQFPFKGSFQVIVNQFTKALQRESSLFSVCLTYPIGCIIQYQCSINNSNFPLGQPQDLHLHSVFAVRHLICMEECKCHSILKALDNPWQEPAISPDWVSLQITKIRVPLFHAILP